MKKPISIEQLADLLEKLAAPNQGISYHAHNPGELRYHERTGHQYWTESRPAELTVYGDRAESIRVLLEQGKIMSDMLRALGQ